MSSRRNGRIILSLGPDHDDLGGLVVLCLVGARPVFPDCAGRVDVARTHGDQFARPHAGQELNPDHRRNSLR